MMALQPVSFSSENKRMSEPTNTGIFMPLRLSHRFCRYYDCMTAAVRLSVESVGVLGVI